MSKYRKHQVIEDSESDDGDDDEFCDSDLEICSQNADGSYLPRLRSGNTNNSNNKKSNKKSNIDMDKFMFHLNDMETSPMSDCDNGEMNKLLQTPLTEQERDIYTRAGIQLIIEHGRARKNDPSTHINITEWKTTKLLHSFNVILRRFGRSYEDYTIDARWSGQDRPYSLDWDELTSLYIPYFRKDFQFYLSKLQKKKATKRPAESRNWNREKEAENNERSKKQNKTISSEYVIG